jgi:hypothetical protein
MTFYRFLRTVGFEHEDIVGGLLPESPARPLEDKREALDKKMHLLLERLVRRRRRIEALRQQISQSHKRQLLSADERDLTRLRRHELAYRHHLAVLARLRRKRTQIREKLVRS